MLLYEDDIRPYSHIILYNKLKINEKIKEYNNEVKKCNLKKILLPQLQSYDLSTLHCKIDKYSGLIIGNNYN